MTKVNILLETNEDGKHIYYPGHLLRGTIEIKFDHPQKLKGIYVTVFGNALVEWSETKFRNVGTGENNRNQEILAHYEGKEVYLNSKIYIFDQGEGEVLELQQGTHKYDFTCHLPEQLPYSFELQYGSIKYYAEAVLDFPWSFEEKVKMPFNIIRHEDLKLYPELKFAQKFEEIESFCCNFLFCEFGDLHMTVTIPYSGFAVGESIPIKIFYDNKGDVDVMSTIIKLRRLIVFKTQTPEFRTKSDREVVAEYDAEGIKGGEIKNFEVILSIPHVLMYSNEKSCKIITISYSVTVRAMVSGCHSNLEICFPVVIGSIPIGYCDPRPESQTPVNQISIPQIPSIQQPLMPKVDRPSAPVANMEDMDDLPPTFEEAMSMVKPDNSPSRHPSTSENIGWNVITPSAPIDEE